MQGLQIMGPNEPQLAQIVGSKKSIILFAHLKAEGFFIVSDTDLIKKSDDIRHYDINIVLPEI